MQTFNGQWARSTLLIQNYSLRLQALIVHQYQKEAELYIKALRAQKSQCCKGSKFSSVQFSCSVVSDSSQPHGLQHTRLPCPSPTPGVYPKSYPLSWWCHPTISSSVVPLSSCLQPFPTSGSFQMSQFFAWGSQRIAVSASISVLPWIFRTDFL